MTTAIRVNVLSASLDSGLLQRVIEQVIADSTMACQSGALTLWPSASRFTHFVSAAAMHHDCQPLHATCSPRQVASVRRRWLHAAAWPTETQRTAAAAAVAHQRQANAVPRGRFRFNLALECGHVDLLLTGAKLATLTWQQARVEAERLSPAAAAAAGDSLVEDASTACMASRITLRLRDWQLLDQLCSSPAYRCAVGSCEPPADHHAAAAAGHGSEASSGGNNGQGGNMICIAVVRRAALPLRPSALTKQRLKSLGFVIPR